MEKDHGRRDQMDGEKLVVDARRGRAKHPAPIRSRPVSCRKQFRLGGGKRKKKTDLTKIGKAGRCRRRAGEKKSAISSRSGGFRGFELISRSDKVRLLHGKAIAKVEKGSIPKRHREGGTSN